LADPPRKTCWPIAEDAEKAGSDILHRLLSRAVWDTDGVHDDLRDHVVEHLGDPAAVLGVDETGDVTKGTATVGTQLQYTSTVGGIEDA
jgi:SRSO17 transposase